MISGRSGDDKHCCFARLTYQLILICVAAWSHDVVQEIVSKCVVKNLIPTKPQSQNLQKTLSNGNRERGKH